MGTVFDAIIAGDIPCAKVHEDDRCLAFLDINPLRTGHALVIPKVAAGKLEDLSADDAAHLMRVTQRLTPALVSAVGAQDATIAIQDGPAAGQEIPHVHIHIVPRAPDDGAGPIHALFRDRPEAGDLDALASSIRSVLEAA